MDAQQIRVGLEHRRDLGLGHRDALLAGHVVGRGDGEAAFPPGRRVETRVRGDQPVQQGRSRAREAEDHQRRRNLLLEDFRVAAHPVAAAQPRDENSVQATRPEIPSAGREPRFLAQRAGQYLERCDDVRLVELGEAGLRACLRDQLVSLQRGLAHRAPPPEARVESGSTAALSRRAATAVRCFAACQAKVIAGPSVAPGPGYVDRIAAEQLPTA